MKTLIVRSKMEENSSLNILGHFGNSDKDGKFWTMKNKFYSNSIKSKLAVKSHFHKYTKVGKSNN